MFNLQPIMMDGCALLSLRVQQAGRERPQQNVFRRHLFWYMNEALFWREADIIRVAR